MFKKYHLAGLYWMEICAINDDGAMNGRDFEADKKWVVEEDTGAEYGTRYFYGTESAKKFNFPSKFVSPKEAIQQVLTYAYTGKAKKLSDMWFKIVIE